MNRTVIFSLFIILLASCNAKDDVQKSTGATDGNSYNYSKLEGTYRGNFDGSEISIVLRHVTGVHAVGYDIFKGARRNLHGQMKTDSAGIAFTLREPGDNINDGVFNFHTDTSGNKLTGTWYPTNNSNIKTKQFTLNRVESNPDEASITGSFTDTSGNGTFSLDDNRQCTYEYYPIVDGKQAEQFIQVKGSWKKTNDSTLTVDWQRNTTFPTRHSIFAISNDDDSGERCFTGEGKKFEVIMP